MPFAPVYQDCQRELDMLKLKYTTRLLAASMLTTGAHVASAATIALDPAAAGNFPIGETVTFTIAGVSWHNGDGGCAAGHDTAVHRRHRGVGLGMIGRKPGKSFFRHG